MLSDKWHLIIRNPQSLGSQETYELIYTQKLVGKLTKEDHFTDYGNRSHGYLDEDLTLLSKWYKTDIHRKLWKRKHRPN